MQVNARFLGVRVGSAHRLLGYFAAQRISGLRGETQRFPWGKLASTGAHPPLGTETGNRRPARKITEREKNKGSGPADYGRPVDT